MEYSKQVIEHFTHPRNFVKKAPKKGEFDSQALSGNPVCGDIIKIWLKIDAKNKKIKKMDWQTFGCAAALATSSVLSEMVEGMEIERAKKITAKDVGEKLGGLPAIKFHCSVVGVQALKEAIEKWEKTN